MLLNQTSFPQSPTAFNAPQQELLDKFNAAFYDAQLRSYTPDQDLLDTFDDAFFSNIDDYEDTETSLIDYLTNDYPDTRNFNEDVASSFDYSELSESFEENVTRNEDQCSQNFSNFFVSPPFGNGEFRISDDTTTCFEGFDNGYDEEGGLLPSMECFGNQSMNLGSFLRNVGSESLEFCSDLEEQQPSNFGHLISSETQNNNGNIFEIDGFSNTIDEADSNCVLMTQNDALLYDDQTLNSEDFTDYHNQDLLQCQWQECYQTYNTQNELVRHIEKCHVEMKRGEEFTCYWYNCPRKTKPFNARYKLLIHMRVHSGEKPNKCPFKGCNKAFSRLENLKIHQRSHTGERPYLCQFSSCTKSFSNSSDRAKHQRTHFDTKPYACQVIGCSKKYTDPSSLRKHVKNHTYEEQRQLKKKSDEMPSPIKVLFPKREKKNVVSCFYGNLEHNYSTTVQVETNMDRANIRQDLKNKLTEKSRQKSLYVDDVY